MVFDGWVLNNSSNDSTPPWAYFRKWNFVEHDFQCLDKISISLRRPKVGAKPCHICWEFIQLLPCIRDIFLHSSLNCPCGYYVIDLLDLCFKMHVYAKHFTNIKSGENSIRWSREVISSWWNYFNNSFMLKISLCHLRCGCLHYYISKPVSFVLRSYRFSACVMFLSV